MSGENAESRTRNDGAEKDSGATSLTANRADYELLNRVVGVRFMTSFPEM